MKRLILTILAGLTLALPLAGNTAPDETQRQMIQHAQEAKRKLAAAEATSGAQRQKMIEEHMAMMQTMMAQMQTAKPGGGMSPGQTREWMNEHIKLMDEMLGQMMREHHVMMQDMGMQGPGKK